MSEELHPVFRCMCEAIGFYVENLDDLADNTKALIASSEVPEVMLAHLTKQIQLLQDCIHRSGMEATRSKT